MDILSGPARIVESGLVTAFMGNPLKLKLDAGASVELVFEATPDQPDVRVETEWTQEGICFHCYNFDDESGRGSREPALLGEWGEDLLFFHFRVFLWGTTADRTVHYTFYLVNKEDVSWEPEAGADGGSQG